MNEQNASSDAAVILERLVSDSRRGERLVLVFDYDGTLVPFAAYPELAQLDPAVRGVLARLAALPLHPRLAHMVIRGRSIRACEIGSVMAGPRPAAPPTMELVRLALPRRAYTQSHYDYVAEACAELFAMRTRMRSPRR